MSLSSDFKEIVSQEFVDVTSMDAQALQEAYEITNSEMDKLYQFVNTYGDYMNDRHEYSSSADVQLTTLEAHLLADIVSMQDATVTALAKKNNRSTSATSQIVRKLIKKGAIIRENSTENATLFYLRPTDLGLSLDQDHKRYDVVDTVKTIKVLRRRCSAEEITGFFNVLEAYLDIIKKDRNI